jgi:aerobic-type carbon monoxide dehydrogenase small subunit (CoxS/CutS family)
VATVPPAVAADKPARGKFGLKSYGPKRVRVTLKVNGKPRPLFIEPRVTLLRALRNELDLTGTKAICEGGACGGCGVLVDGTVVNSCMTLALDAVGKDVTTIEGLAKGDELHPVQAAFCKADALQCGFCTPGMIIAAKALLDRNPKPSLEEIKRGMAGNICRCGTYNRIFAAVESCSKAG